MKRLSWLLLAPFVPGCLLLTDFSRLDCGDGLLAPDAGEDCDDGNTTPGDGCDAECLTEFCGDGILNNNGEACDDGNAESGDGCSDACVVEFCGDGITNNGEDCDDGDEDAGDGCAPGCVLEFCGDNILNNNGEDCDDGNATPGDGCSELCAIERCGDGTVNNAVLPLAEIVLETAVANCGGQGFTLLLNGVEAEIAPPNSPCDCNAGVSSLSITDPVLLAAASSNVNRVAFRSDDPNLAFAWATATFRLADGTTTEQLLFDINGGNDAQNRNPDVCSAGFLFGGINESAPPFVLGVISEQCDDGNLSSGDGCNSGCANEICSDGIVNNAGQETCDDGNLTSGDGCDENCTPTACGNGVITAGEQCDDGNLANEDGCDQNCLIECGNGILNANEACDDGNLASGDGCDANCTVTACGNGIIAGPEQCDDANTNPDDGCDAACAIEPGALCRAQPSICFFPAEECAEATPLDEGTLSGDTNDGDPFFINDIFFFCAPTGFGKELLFQFTPPAPGLLSLSLEVQSAHALYLRQNCEDPFSELGCTEVFVGTGTLDVGLSGPVTLFVDARNPGDEGPFTLSLTFTEPVCGDGIIVSPEQCDDGNLSSGDGCSDACIAEFCLDGILNNAGLEQCDDGNLTNGDGCDTNCTLTACGNGIATAPEQCDDQNLASGDGCDQSCTLEGNCAHSICQLGGPLSFGCSPCVDEICAVDSFCCNNEWDGTCVSEVLSICSISCSF